MYMARFVVLLYGFWLMYKGNVIYRCKRSWTIITRWTKTVSECLAKVGITTNLRILELQNWNLNSSVFSNMLISQCGWFSCSQVLFSFHLISPLCIIWTGHCSDYLTDPGQNVLISMEFLDCTASKYVDWLISCWSGWCLCQVILFIHYYHFHTDKQFLSLF